MQPEPEPEPDPEPEWLFPREAIYAASYLFYGRAPPFPEFTGSDWGRGRRPEEDEAATRGVWGYAVIILTLAVGTYLIHTLDSYDPVAVTEHAAVALLPTCRPLAHGPPMCYDWERPSGSGDGDSRHDEDRKASMECFTGPARTTGTALSLLPTCLPFAYYSPAMCYEWERPAMEQPGGGSRDDSNWSNNDDDEKAAMECFYGLVRDATRTCGYEWKTSAMVPPGNGSVDSNWTGIDEKAIMECFYSLVRDGAKSCFGRSYENVRPDE